MINRPITNGKLIYTCILYGIWQLVYIGPALFLSPTVRKNIDPYALEGLIMYISCYALNFWINALIFGRNRLKERTEPPKKILPKKK